MSENQASRDRTRGYFSCALMVLAFVLPVVGFAVGWGRWDAQTGAMIGGGIFVLLMGTAVLIAFTIENLSWLFTFLPLLSSFIYTIAPDFVPGPIEDAVVIAVGAFFTLTLLVKKIAPSYVLLAVVVTGLYAWFGRYWIAGPVDELVLFLIVLLLGFIVHRNYRQRLSGDV
ncbi:MAG TPA: hypothetical protein PLD25_05300 [Chloroflexota bacterium]|nr:hypothetical protein [Chloroflexota bacterium]HUM71772.1 hypothetical protein [Chloroflexota bacterium]